MNYYSYEELKTAALSPSASQTDIDNLGEWFERHGSMYWNGEYYEIDRDNRLFPIYEEVEEDEFEITGYEIR